MSVRDSEHAREHAPDRPREWASGRVAFCAHRLAIRDALLEGHARVTVYERFRARLGISYKQFLRYVDRYVPDAPVVYRRGEARDAPTYAAPVGSPREHVPPSVPNTAAAAPRTGAGLPPDARDPGASTVRQPGFHHTATPRTDDALF